MCLLRSLSKTLPAIAIAGHHFVSPTDWSDFKQHARKNEENNGARNSHSSHSFSNLNVNSFSFVVPRNKEGFLVEHKLSISLVKSFNNVLILLYEEIDDVVTTLAILP